MIKLWRAPFHRLKYPRDVGEHYEGHTAMTVLTKISLGIKGRYNHHPGIRRFIGHEGMLISRHAEQVAEFRRRGYPCGVDHPSPVPELFLWLFTPEPYVYSESEMLEDLAVLESRGGVKQP